MSPDWASHSLDCMVMSALPAEADRQLNFGYGANLDGSVYDRCPDAIDLGNARLPDHRWLATAAGVATVVRHPRGVVHGVLWSLSARDLENLDRFEATELGFYRRERHEVITDAGERARAWVYFANQPQAGEPIPLYLAAIVEAARQRRFPTEYIAELQAWGSLSTGAEAGRRRHWQDVFDPPR